MKMVGVEHQRFGSWIPVLLVYMLFIISISEKQKLDYPVL